MGVIHPDYLESRLTTRQMTEWMIYGSLEPFGEHANWIRSAVAICTYVNSKKKKGSKRCEVKDFMPGYYFPEKDKEQSPQEMMAVLNQIKSAQNKKHG